MGLGVAHQLIPAGTSFVTAIAGSGGGGGLPVTSGLAGWWDADDATTFSYSSGTVVSQWRDKSGNGSHATVAGGQSAPTRDVSIFNGRAACTFVVAAPPNILISPMRADHNAITVFVVADSNWDGNQAYIGAAGGDGGLEFRSTTGRTFQLLKTFVALLGESTGTAPLSGPFVAEVAYNNTSGGSFYINGVSAGSIANGSPFDTSPQTYIGASAMALSDLFHGHVAEIIKYDRVLTTPERQQVEAYLTDKWIPASPIPLTGLAGWWDADDATTFTLTGAVVDQWRDKSGNNVHLTAPTAPQKPSRSGTQNGKATVNFAYNVPYQQVRTATGSTNIGAANNAATIFAVFKSIGTPSYGAFPGLLSAGNGGAPFEAWAGGRNISGVNLGAYTDIAVQTSWTVLCDIPWINAGASGASTCDEYKDGAFVKTSGTVGGGVLTTANQVVIIGARDDGVTQFLGEVAELIMYDRKLTTPERQQVEAYLKTKWGTP